MLRSVENDDFLYPKYFSITKEIAVVQIEAVSGPTDVIHLSNPNTSESRRITMRQVLKRSVGAEKFMEVHRCMDLIAVLDAAGEPTGVFAANAIPGVVFKISTPLHVVPARELASMCSRSESMAREIAALIKLGEFEHPGVVRLLAFGACEQKIWGYLMPYGNDSVHNVWVRYQRSRVDIPYMFGVRLKTEICNALAFIHAMGIAHRDVSLENIIVLPDGRFQLIDFGLCIGLTLQDATSGQWRRITFEGVPGGARWQVGKDKYMPPEFFILPDGENSVYDAPKADVFAFGVSLFVIKFHVYPQGADANKKEDRASLTRLWEAYPMNVERLLGTTMNQQWLSMTCLQKMLSKDAETRCTAHEAYMYGDML